MSAKASTVIPLPLSVVESNLWNVTAWPSFVADVEWVERTSHERYVFGVRQGRRVHDVRAAVRWHARDHRVSWRELEGPAWRGELRLQALNGRRTRVEMSVSVHPRTFLGSVSEMFGGSQRDLHLDLNRLSERFAAIPQPTNPARLTPPRRIGERPARPSTAVTTGRPSGPDHAPAPAHPEVAEFTLG